MESQKIISDTIVAIATPHGTGGIAVIRVSGTIAIETVDKIWQGKTPLSQTKSHTVHFGTIINAEGDPLDQVVATTFRAPHSFTGENTVEIACHGSIWIQNQIVRTLIDNGCRPANGGEFTQRAFINRRIDLAQAEAVADLIASSSQTSHKIAMSQMRGQFSNALKNLRHKLLHFASLIELELDFSEEDVEFADRKQMKNLANEIKQTIDKLAKSFAIGSAIKSGIPIAIAGTTNVGKSTLLNTLLNDDKAIVSDIHGTTRDTIEDTIEIESLLFRFIDTAGLRNTTDIVENLGIERTQQKIAQASTTLWLIDPTADITPQTDELRKHLNTSQTAKNTIVIINKSDLNDNTPKQIEQLVNDSLPIIHISAAEGTGIEQLKQKLCDRYSISDTSDDIIITNARHYDALKKASESLKRVINGMENAIPTDPIALDIRQTIHQLGEITGEITTDDLLGNIFAHFCIGK